jgi:hypothetical protein
VASTSQRLVKYVGFSKFRNGTLGNFPNFEKEMIGVIQHSGRRRFKVILCFCSGGVKPKYNKKTRKLFI